MRNIKLIIEYDGSGYHGWQSQDNAITVQKVIEDSLKTLTGEDINLIGSSRTDTGVHALGMVANFVTNTRIPGDKFSYALNNVLPDDIVIKASIDIHPEFHSRFDAKGKKYRYLIYNSIHPSAIFRNRTFHVYRRLDLDAMKRAARCFIGTHDFEAFKSIGGSSKTSIRTIYKADIIEQDDEIISFEIEGNGFLYNMVRIIVGTLIEVGIGKLCSDDVSGVILSRDRKKAGRTAPPQGLYLVEVFYDERVKSEMITD